MVSGLPERSTIPLGSIEPDSTLLGRWCRRIAVAVSLVVLAILLIVGPGRLGAPPSIFRHQPTDPFIGWLTGILCALTCLVVALDRWLAHRYSRVDVDRTARSVRVLHHGLWNRRDEAMPLGSVRDLALVETQDDGAPVWRLEFRPTQAAGRTPLVVATTHDLDRLDPLAQRIAREAGLELVRVRRRARS